MSYNLIYIINNKLHNNKYKVYTLIFYALIMHSYYILYKILVSNNYIAIFIYFALLLLFYIKFKKFSYIICYIYLLFIFSFFLNKAKENMTLREKVQARRANTEAILKSSIPEPTNNVSPCEEYIMTRVTTEAEINISPSANNAQTGKVDTKIIPSRPGPALNTKIVE
jgi:hypothetical protein